MLSFASGRRTFLYVGITDMRRSIDGLAGLVRSDMGAEPLSGDLFGFSNRRRDRIKLLVFDGSGFWVFYKRLEKGTFGWPQDASPGGVSLSPTDLNLLLDGIDLSTVRRRSWFRFVAA